MVFGYATAKLLKRYVELGGNKRFDVSDPKRYPRLSAGGLLEPMDSLANNVGSLGTQLNDAFDGLLSDFS